MTKKYLIDTTTSSQGWPNMQQMLDRYHGRNQQRYDDDDPTVEVAAKDLLPSQPILRKDVLRRRNKEKDRHRRGAFLGVAVVALVVTLAATQGNSDKKVEAQALEDLNNQTPIEQVGPAQVEQPEAAVAISLELPKDTQRIIEAQMPQIEELKPLYIEAAERVNLPWQAIAAIHYRECNNDKESSAFSGVEFGDVNPDTGKVDPTDKVENYIAALEHLKKVAKKFCGVELTIASPIEDWAKALLAYNRGGMYEVAVEFEGKKWTFLMSPYVMNGLFGYEHMSFPDRGHYDSNDSTKCWGEPESVHGKRDKRDCGALAMMIGLGWRPGN